MDTAMISDLRLRSTSNIAICSIRAYFSSRRISARFRNFRRIINISIMLIEAPAAPLPSIEQSGRPSAPVRNFAILMLSHPPKSGKTVHTGGASRSGHIAAAVNGNSAAPP